MLIWLGVASHPPIRGNEIFSYEKKFFFEEDDFIIWHRFRATFIFRQNLKIFPRCMA